MTAEERAQRIAERWGDSAWFRDNEIAQLCADITAALEAHAAEAVEVERANYADPEDVKEVIDGVGEAVDELDRIAEFTGCGPDERIAASVRRRLAEAAAQARREALNEAIGAMPMLPQSLKPSAATGWGIGVDAYAEAIRALADKPEETK